MTVLPRKRTLIFLFLLGIGAIVTLLFVDPLMEALSGNAQIQLLEERLLGPSPVAALREGEHPSGGEAAFVGPAQLEGPPLPGQVPADPLASDDAGMEETDAAALEGSSLLAPKIAGGEERAWQVLERMERWNAESAPPPESELRTYFQHSKLWVRLSALQIALERQLYTVEQLQEVASDIRSRHDRGQIGRWLARPRASNPEVYGLMRGMLEI